MLLDCRVQFLSSTGRVDPRSSTTKPVCLLLTFFLWRNLTRSGLHDALTGILLTHPPRFVHSRFFLLEGFSHHNVRLSQGFFLSLSSECTGGKSGRCVSFDSSRNFQTPNSHPHPHQQRRRRATSVPPSRFLSCIGVQAFPSRSPPSICLQAAHPGD